MRVVFMGSPEFAVPPLRALIEQHEVALVVTQPDKRAGRGKHLSAPPVKEVALAAGIPVQQPASAKKPEFAQMLRETGAELGVVVAYGKILPKAVLDAFPRGCINIHGSILPKYRGAAPIQWAVIRGETVTGVTIMRLDEGMDTGPMLLVRELAIAPEDTAGDVFAKMAPLGADAMLEALAGLAAGTLAEIPQDPSAATYAPMLSKEDGIVSWADSAQSVAARIRGVDPWPGAESYLDGERLKLFRPRVLEQGAMPQPEGTMPGSVLGLCGEGLAVACGQGSLVAIGELQAPGRKRLPARQFVSGYAIPDGAVLRPPAHGAGSEMSEP